MWTQQRAKATLCRGERCARPWLAAQVPPTEAFFHTEAASLLHGRFGRAAEQERELNQASARLGLRDVPSMCVGGAQNASVLLLGAGNGALALALSLHGCTVHAVEPVPILASAMEQTALRSGLGRRMLVHRVAAGAERASIVPFVAPLSSLLRSHRRACRPCAVAARCIDGGQFDLAPWKRNASLRVQVVPLTDLALRIPPPSVVFFDLGADNEAALRGSGGLLRAAGAWERAALIFYEPALPSQDNSARTPCGVCATRTDVRVDSLASFGRRCHWFASTMNRCERPATLVCGGKR